MILKDKERGLGKINLLDKFTAILRVAITIALQEFLKWMTIRQIK